MAGFTHSRYRPAWIRTRVPGVAACAARLIVRKGCASLPSFSFRWLLENKSEAPETVAVNGRRFRVYGTLSHPTGARRGTMLATTYWFDVTEAEALREASEKGKPIVGVVMLDNYDELMKAGTEASRSALLARINEKLNAWVDGAESLFCRLDRNQYLFVTTQEKYAELVKAKFSVLDSVREVVTEDGVAATLSIGVGKDAAGHLRNDLVVSGEGDAAIQLKMVCFQPGTADEGLLHGRRRHHLPVEDGAHLQLALRGRGPHRKQQQDDENQNPFHKAMIGKFRIFVKEKLCQSFIFYVYATYQSHDHHYRTGPGPDRLRFEDRRPRFPILHRRIR